MKQCLYCKFEHEEKVKELGAHWDTDVEKWFVDRITDELTAYEEVIFFVPYELKDSYKKKQYQMESNCEILDNEA